MEHGHKPKRRITSGILADREADFYDLFACSRRQGSDFLIRATQNRRLVGGEQH